MTTSSGISNLVAAELSQAAYDKYEPADLPAGWADDFSYYYNNGTNSFSTFVNAATRQVVIAFKGTDTLAQFQSDVANEGGAEWESIKGEFASVLASIRAALPGYQIMTDGHSLGGGMAQTAALESGLSGYGQNSLPISPDAIQDMGGAGGLAAALVKWRIGGHTFSEATISNDITTTVYAGDLDLYTNPITSADTSTTILPNVYAGLESDGLTISADGNQARGAAVYALAEDAAHGIADVIGELQPNPANLVSVPVAFLLTDQSDLDAVAGGFGIVDSAADIAAAFNALEADASHIQSIGFSDAGMPVLTLTAPQAAADASLLSKIGGSFDLEVIGVTGKAYASYEESYVDGQVNVSEYLAAAPAGAPYSYVETDYGYAGAYIGEKLITAGIKGRSYTGEEQDFGAEGHLRRVVQTGVEGQTYTSIERDYNKSGALTGITYDVTNAPGESYLVGQFHHGASGGLRWETAELQNGGYQITGEANGATLVSHGDDVMTGGGSDETFVLHTMFGADSITDFSSHASGAGHDIISLTTADFADFHALLSAATNSGSNVSIAAPHGQTLTLDGLNTATLAGLAADFTFHSWN
jgi:hypothetical protein